MPVTFFDWLNTNQVWGLVYLVIICISFPTFRLKWNPEKKETPK